jgi:cephalosporin hydroxylase
MAMISSSDTVMVILDSNHTRDHVRAELELYAPHVSDGSAIVVMDTIMPRLAGLPGASQGWRTDHPGLAIHDFLSSRLGREFRIDHTYDAFAVTHSPGGILLRHALESQSDG